MWRVRIVVLLWCLLPCFAHAAIPTNASNDSDFALGYLECNHYSGVLDNETGNATSGIQTCITDAWLNGLAWRLRCGTYLVNDTLTMYEWQNWDVTSRMVPDPRAHVFRGSHAGGCKPKLKIITGTTAFNNASAPRPLLIWRNFTANSSSATDNDTPTNPMGLPANFGEITGNLFRNVIENLEIDLNGHAGAIGLAVPMAQNGGVYNVKITATGAFAGIYGLPGRNSMIANVEIIGGQHCIGGGSIWGLSPSLDNTAGSNVVGLTCTNQTATAIEVSDTVPLVITGLNITKSAAGAPIRIRSPFVIVDGRISLSSGAANILAIDNVDGHTGYVRNVYIEGTADLIKSVATTTTGTGPWARLTEYSYANQFNKDGITTPTTYPTYALNETQFEVRSLIEGVLSGGAFPVVTVDNNTAFPPTDIVTRHVWESWPSHEDVGGFENPDNYGDCNSVRITPGYGQDPEEDGGIAGPDCTAEIQTAIDNAATAGHNRVHLPTGTVAISGAINLHKDTKLMSAGGAMNGQLVYKSTWAPTGPNEAYFVTTDSDATGTAHMHFVGFYVKTSVDSQQFMAHYHWRIGKNSVVVNPFFEFEHSPPDEADQPLKMIRFSANGGGKHYGLHNSFEQYDGNLGVRMIYAQDTTQPLSFYGQNLEITKPAPPAYSDANLEFVNVSNARVYGCKREGQSPTAKITDSDNIAIYGCGGFSLSPQTGKVAFLQVLGASSNILAAVHVVRENEGNTTALPMLRQAITGFSTFDVSPYPNGLSYYDWGTIDDSVFAAPTEPLVPAVGITGGGTFQ